MVLVFKFFTIMLKTHRIAGSSWGIVTKLVSPALRRPSTTSFSSHRAMATLISGDTFFLDHFALRQWEDPNFAGTRMVNCDKHEFVEKVHAHFKATGEQLVDGYAPFCKHVFIPNEWDCPVGALPITDENRHLLQSAYTRRRNEELAVLTRWLPKALVSPPQAAYLDIILYSRPQMVKEYAALPLEGRSAADLPAAPWGIISIKAQNEPHETPMTPMTMMRNALGKEEGGSGVPLDREKYEAACEYWETHAALQ